MIGDLYICKHPEIKNAQCIVRIVRRWNGKGPLNVLVELIDDDTVERWGFVRTSYPERKWIRPFRGLRRWITHWDKEAGDE